MWKLDEASQFPEKEYINGIFVAVQVKGNLESTECKIAFEARLSRNCLYIAHFFIEEKTCPNLIPSL
jgi:hypothetical protein